MVLKPEPIFAAVDSIRRDVNTEVVVLSASGRRFTQFEALRLSRTEQVILICGRYEGIDERVVEHLATCEISIGDFVLSGGELAAMALIDAVVRQLPGALGDGASAVEESFADGLLDCPQYTRPEVWSLGAAGGRVPEVLLSGHHANIRRWRLKQALGRTWLRRPELLEIRTLSAEEQGLLDEFKQER